MLGDDVLYCVRSRIILLIFCLLISNFVFAADSIRVHFLYGSRPLRSCPDEPKWFGGILGGHVGVEIDPGKVLHFLPQGGMHIFGKKNNRHSDFYISPLSDFWEVLGCCDSSVKKLSINIPIDSSDLISLRYYSKRYLRETPYDYAFFGMRCASATYDILERAGLVRERSHLGKIFGIFYPRKLRKRLIKKAELNVWSMQRQEGIPRRKWEHD